MKKQIMFFGDCLKQQIYNLAAYFIAFAVSYKIAIFFKFREPHQLAVQDIVIFSFGFIFFGSIFRFCSEKP
ncbi:MAG: hypothetical protein NTZ68_04445 [Candidatus Dependentiae bacterium]|nr:hypothetical protein [Candidatus Dependentiae bacterium]